MDTTSELQQDAISATEPLIVPHFLDILLAGEYA